MQWLQSPPQEDLPDLRFFHMDRAASPTHRASTAMTATDATIFDMALPPYLPAAATLLRRWASEAGLQPLRKSR